MGIVHKLRTMNYSNHKCPLKGCKYYCNLISRRYLSFHICDKKCINDDILNIMIKIGKILTDFKEYKLLYSNICEDRRTLFLNIIFNNILSLKIDTNVQDTYYKDSLKELEYVIKEIIVL